MNTRKLSLILIVLGLMIFACNLPGADEASPVEPDAQEETAETEETAPPAEPEEDDEVDDQEEVEDDIPPVSLACPESVTGKLVLNHSWDFSPANDETIQISGSTIGESAWCVITIEGAAVIFDECEFVYSNSGTISTDDGECSVSGEGTAAIEVTGSCQDGIVTLEISEFSEGDLGNTMTCPNVSQPYPTFFPPSLLEFDFLIAVGGDTWTHFGMIDMSFNYTKAWTLLLPDSYFDMP